MEDSSFYQVWRLISLLMRRMKRQAPDEEACENPSRTLNVNENVAVQRKIERLAMAVAKNQVFENMAVNETIIGEAGKKRMLKCRHYLECC
jgi:hypothetical protein